MSDHRLPSAPDYTTAALVMMGVNLMWVFLVIWAMFGLIPVLLIGAVLNHAISLLASRG